MHDDPSLDDLMREAAPGYRPPPPPRLEVMWERIEARAWPAARPGRRLRWPLLLAHAATLVVGVGIGLAGARLGGPVAAPEPAVAVQSARFLSEPNPFVGVATDYLQQTTALLITVTGAIAEGQVPPATITQARHLLSTTRLLLDAGESDPVLRDLLEDLELVLAQVVQLPATRQAPDAALISQALDQRDVLPRLTLLLADASQP